MSLLGRSSVVVLSLLSLGGCGKRANVGPPAKTQVMVETFDGQKLTGRLTLLNAAGGQVSGDGKLTLTLITDRDLCSVSTEVHKSGFVPLPGDPSLTHMPLALSMPAPCPRPAAAGAPMNMRVTFEGADGVKLQAVQNAMAASDWAGKLQDKDDAASLRARIPRETTRLASVVDVVPKAGEKPTTMLCPPEVKKGAVARILTEHLLQIAGRAPGTKNYDVYYHWISEQRYEWLAGWVTKTANITETGVAEELGDPKPFLEVVRVDAFTTPAVTGQSREEKHGNTTTHVMGFTPGALGATVTILDVAKKTIVCRGNVSARSSSGITASGGETLAIDLHDNFEKAIAGLETTIARAPLR